MSKRQLDEDTLALELIQKEAEEYRKKHNPNPNPRNGEGDGSKRQRVDRHDGEKDRDRPRGRNDEGEPLCYVCSELGHLARDCPNKSQDRGRGGGGGRGVCYQCGKHGHYSRDCPESRGGRGREQEKPSSSYQWGKREEGDGDEGKPKTKEDEVSYEPSGALTEDLEQQDSSLYKNGVKLTWTAPTEVRVPKKLWKLYVFKGDELVEEVSVYKLSSYLIGKDRRVADIPSDHPSVSKQHAVLCFRSVETESSVGVVKRVIRPYIIDLESTNGTMLNGKKIEGARYVELKEKDVLKFGFSSREYVLLHAQSKE